MGVGNFAEESLLERKRSSALIISLYNWKDALRQGEKADHTRGFLVCKGENKWRIQKRTRRRCIRKEERERGTSIK